MRTDAERIALFEIASARTHLTAIEVTLMTIAGDLGPPCAQPMIGMPDIHFTGLLAAESRLIRMDADAVAMVAGTPASDALTAYQACFRGLQDVYGLACGPDRDAATAAALMDTLRGVAARAHRQLTLYAAHTQGLDQPTLEAYTQAITRRSKEPRPAMPEPERALTPRMRRPFDGDLAATRARAALGYAFGGLGSAYMKLRGPAGPYTGMVVLGDLAGVTAWVGARGSQLTRRCAYDDSALAARVEGISDDLDALYHDLERAIAERDAGPEALPALADQIMSRIPRIRDAIHAVERFAAERGYTIAPPAFQPAPQVTTGFAG